MTLLRFVAAEAWHEMRAACRGPLIPIVFPALIGYVILVVLNAEYMRAMGGTNVPRNSPHVVYLMVSVRSSRYSGPTTGRSTRVNPRSVRRRTH